MHTMMLHSMIKVCFDKNLVPLYSQIGWRRSNCGAVLKKVEKFKRPLCPRDEEEEEET